jgi:acyl dehydratase
MMSNNQTTNEYTLEDLAAKISNGETISTTYRFTLTEELHKTFEQMCGSHNPLHTDDEFAQSRGFREKIGYGFLTAAILSPMIGEYIPGRFGMCRAVKCEFHSPVYIGDTLTYTGVLKSVHKSVRQAAIDVVVTNQNDEIVAKAEMKAGVSQ